jgi:hypothetical protein
MLVSGLVLLPVLIDPALCRQQSSGPARWQTDGRGTLTASTEARFTGEIVMRCSVRVGQNAAQVLLQFENVEISFQPAGSRESGSGVVIEAGWKSCEWRVRTGYKVRIVRWSYPEVRVRVKSRLSCG